MSELAKLKRQLYAKLLSLDDPTDSEIEIIFCLGKDKDIQEIFKEAIKKAYSHDNS